jgi:hypothetical protein
MVVFSDYSTVGVDYVTRTVSRLGCSIPHSGLGCGTTEMSTASKSYILFRQVLTSLRSPYFRRRITLSAVEGAREPSLDNSTLPEYFAAKALSRRPEYPALICRQEHPRAHGGPLSKNMGVESHLAWDFNEFDSHIRALARGLVGLGVNKGDRVGVIMGNTRYVFLAV